MRFPQSTETKSLTVLLHHKLASDVKGSLAGLQRPIIRRAPTHVSEPDLHSCSSSQGLEGVTLDPVPVLVGVAAVHDPL